MNNLPCCAAASRPGLESATLIDRKSDALPLSHRATPVAVAVFSYNINVYSPQSNVAKLLKVNKHLSKATNASDAG